MVKTFLHKICSSILALLVLVSTVSFTVEKHYCGDTLVDVALFSHVKKCGMETGENGIYETMKKHCCKDEISLVKGQDKLKITTFEDLKLHHQLFITSLVYSFVNRLDNLPKNIVPHKDYSPPNLAADIQLLDEVFII